MILKYKELLKKDFHFRELISGSSKSFVIQIIGVMVSYAFIYTVTNSYGAATLGVFVLSITILNVVAVFGRLGMNTMLLRLVSENASKNQWYTVKKIVKKAFITVALVSITISIITYLLAHTIADKIFGKEHIYSFIELTALVITPFILLSLFLESLRGLKKIATYMFIQQIGIYSLAIITLLFFIFLEYKTDTNTLVAYILSVIIIFITTSLILVKNIKKQPKQVNEVVPTLNQLLEISIPMMFASSFVLFISWSDIIMLGMFTTDTEVGIYSVALKIALVMTIPLTALNSIAAPKFAEFWGHQDLTNLKNIATKSTKLIFWITLPLFLFIITLPNFFLKMFGDEFVSGVLVLTILAFGVFINALSGSVGHIIEMTGHQRIQQKILLIAAVLNILLNYILIPSYGMEGAAIATVITTSFWNLSYVLFIKKKFGFYTFAYIERDVKL